ncbi:hypothetical protein E2974_15935 [Paracoccus yeei]|uniref:hypothetical protein n=1 Tax=Paracoccus yeei TaxID=147645 RepID=UPI0037D52ADA
MTRDIDETFASVKDGIRSKDRVKNLAEVFTAEREVKAMLDLIGDPSYAIETTYLEPACGNGNFLVEILARKCRTIKSRYSVDGDGRRVQVDILRSIATISAIDISPGNVTEARSRMLALTEDLYRDILSADPPTAFSRLCASIFERKIVVGDFLERVGTLHDIRIADDLSITCRPHHLRNLFPPAEPARRRKRGRP